MHVADGQPFLVSRYTVNLIKMQHPYLSGLDPSLMDLLMCLVSAETFEYLLRSQVPTLRVDTNNRGFGDDSWTVTLESALRWFLTSTISAKSAIGFEVQPWQTNLNCCTSSTK